MADITRNESGRIDPTSSQLDPTQEYNQLRPISQRSSGTELDESCGPYSGSLSPGAGKSLDEMIEQIDGGGK